MKILILFAFFAIQETLTHFEVADPKVVTIRKPGYFSAGIFGCWGSGSCYEDIIINGMVVPPTEGNSTVMTKENGRIKISFNYSTFNDNNKEYYMSRNVWENPEDSALLDSEANGLQLPIGTKLLAGNYPITRVGDKLIVYVNYLEFGG